MRRDLPRTPGPRLPLVSRLAAAWLSLLCTICLPSAPAGAQEAAPEEGGEERTLRLLPRYAFHLSGEYLTEDDPAFGWSANYGGVVDLVDFGYGRLTITANYEVLLGEKLRSFDPNQGNYTLAASASARVRALELIGTFHHVSRHLSDREKQRAVDWNMIGLHARTVAALGATAVDARAGVFGVTLTSFVDYSWELDTGVDTRTPVHPRVTLLGRGNVRVLGTDGSADRGTQTGFRFEGGLGLEGDAGAMELFLSAERRIDPSPLEFGTATWGGAGVRFVRR